MTGWFINLVVGPLTKAISNLRMNFASCLWFKYCGVAHTDDSLPKKRNFPHISVGQNPHEHKRCSAEWQQQSLFASTGEKRCDESEWRLRLSVAHILANIRVCFVRWIQKMFITNAFAEVVYTKVVFFLLNFIKRVMVCAVCWDMLINWIPYNTKGWLCLRKLDIFGWTGPLRLSSMTRVNRLN